MHVDMLFIVLIYVEMSCIVLTYVHIRLAMHATKYAGFNIAKLPSNLTNPCFYIIIMLIVFCNLVSIKKCFGLC